MLWACVITCIYLWKSKVNLRHHHSACCPPWFLDRVSLMAWNGLIKLNSCPESPGMCPSLLPQCKDYTSMLVYATFYLSSRIKLRLSYAFYWGSYLSCSHVLSDYTNSRSCRYSYKTQHILLGSKGNSPKYALLSQIQKNMATANLNSHTK